MSEKKPKNRVSTLKLSLWVVCGIFLSLGWGSLSAANGWDEKTPDTAVLALSDQYKCGINKESKTDVYKVTQDPYCNSINQESSTAPLCKSNTYCEKLTDSYNGVGSNEDPINLLPAYRWKSAVGELDNTYGYDGADLMRGALSTFASFFMLAAGLVWWAILGLARLSILLNPLASESIGGVVNDAFLAMSNGVSAGLIWIPIAGSLLFAVINPLRGPRGAASPMSLIIFLALPIGALWGMTTATERGLTVDPVSKQMVSTKVGTGSPVWMARTTTQIVDDISGFMMAGMSQGLVETRLRNSLGSVDASATPSCAAYINSLNGAFTRAWEKSPYSLSGDGRGLLQTLSTLWYSTQGQAWERAQFSGNSVDANRMSCHYLERQAQISSTEQALIGAAAGYPIPRGMNLASQLQKVNPLDQSAVDNVVYGPYLGTNPRWKTGGDLDSVKDRQGLTMHWAACSFNGQRWVMAPPYLAVEGTGDLDGRSGDDQCEEWWNGTNTTTNGWSGPFDKVFQWEDESFACDGKEQCRIQEVYLAMHGKNTPERLLAGLTSLITALLYLYGLGALLLGVMISKVFLLAMIVLLPFTLFLLALPKWRVDPKHAQRHKTGMKLMKQTLGFALSTATLQVVVILLVILTGLIRSVLNPFNYEGIMDFVSPLLALVLLRFLLKAAGLGDISPLPGGDGGPLKSLSNAMAMPYAAAKAAGAEEGNRLRKAKEGLAQAQAAEDGMFNAGAKALNSKMANRFKPKPESVTEDDIDKIASGLGDDADEATRKEAAAALDKLSKLPAAQQEKAAKALMDSLGQDEAEKLLNDPSMSSRKSDRLQQALEGAKKANDEAKTRAEERQSELDAASTPEERAAVAANHAAQDAAAAAAAAIVPQLGNRLTRSQVADKLMSGEMPAFVNDGHGGQMALQDALSGGLVEMTAGGDLQTTARGAAQGVSFVENAGGVDMFRQMAAHDQALGSLASATTLARQAGAAAGLDAGMLSGVRGRGAVMTPLAGNTLGFADAKAAGNADWGKLLGSTAAATMALPKSLTDELWTASGGNEEIYAAALSVAADAAGIGGMTLEQALTSGGVLRRGEAASVLRDLQSGRPASIASAVEDLRTKSNPTSMSMSAGECVAAAQSMVQAGRSSDVAMGQAAVLASKQAHTPAIAKCQDMFDDYTRGTGVMQNWQDGKASSRQVAEVMAAADVAVAQVRQEQSRLEAFASTGVMPPPDVTDWDKHYSQLVETMEDNLDRSRAATKPGESRNNIDLIRNAHWLSSHRSGLMDEWNSLGSAPAVSNAGTNRHPSSAGVVTKLNVSGTHSPRRPRVTTP
jgi:hypothetical protein